MTQLVMSNVACPVCGDFNLCGDEQLRDGQFLLECPGCHTTVIMLEQPVSVVMDETGVLEPA